MGNRYQTEWVGKFAVACELARRNYLISWPIGNAPILDIICRSPSGKTFSLQVKSFRAKGFILIGSPVNRGIGDLWFIFVHVPNKLQQAVEYFIIPQQKLMDILQKERQEAKIREQQRGQPYKQWAEGVYYKNILGFKDKWHLLPM